VLGLINPTTFLGGRKQLDRDAAVAVIRKNVADPLGLSVEEAAWGIKQIVDSKMSDLIRRVTIHEGYDPREFALVAYGGAGPVHAHSFAAGLGVKRLVVPKTASVHSAFGVLNSDLVVTTERSVNYLTPPGSTGASEHIDAGEVEKIVQGLEAEAVGVLEAQGLTRDAITIERVVDMRFRFQIHELTIPVDGEVTPEALDGLVTSFIETYEARMGEGTAFTAAGTEFVTFRIVATGRVDRPSQLADAAASGNGDRTVPIRTDRIYVGEWLEAQVYDEASVTADASYSGPAIIELADTNIVIGADQSATVDTHGNVLISL
jgi:N-methylhydantoinase A